jgi:hypothetical protein
MHKWEHQQMQFMIKSGQSCTDGCVGGNEREGSGFAQKTINQTIISINGVDKLSVRVVAKILSPD